MKKIVLATLVAGALAVGVSFACCPDCCDTDTCCETGISCTKN